MLRLAKNGNLVLAFLLELVALWAVGAWGWHRGATTTPRVLLALGAVAGWAGIWGVFLSPRARVALSPAAAAAGQWGMFALAVAALAFTGRPAAAVGVAAAVVVNRILLTGHGRKPG